MKMNQGHFTDFYTNQNDIYIPRYSVCTVGRVKQGDVVEAPVTVSPLIHSIDRKANPSRGSVL